MVKIAVIGYSGSGKSTLAALLANKYSIPLLHLDTVQFRENWQERDFDEALETVTRFMQQDDWIIDGNYAKFLRDERLMKADRIIFMDFSRLSCLHRVIKRYRTYKNRTRESMAPGCPEKLDVEFVTWVLFGGRKKKYRLSYKNILKKYGYKTTVIKNQRQLDGFYGIICGEETS
ncbi:MAG: DNA topology modulation protein [Eubacteriales bacterium]